MLYHKGMNIRKTRLVIAGQYARIYMCIGMVFLCLLNLSGTAAAGSPKAVPADIAQTTPGLSPHKALYDITMTSRKSSGQIVNIGGQMLYEWYPGCEAWVTNHRFNLLYEYTDHPPMRIASNFTTYETYDGTSLNFSSQRKRNGRLFQELRGKATRDKQTGEGVAVNSMPDGMRFELPRGTLFPMAHTIKLLEKVHSGQRIFNSTIFDGSDEDGPIEISAFIGREQPYRTRLKKVTPQIDQTLLEKPARNIRLAFFPLENDSEDAEYEMDIMFHDNGVISDMVVEYRLFSVRQTLVALEKTIPETCD